MEGKCILASASPALPRGHRCSRRPTCLDASPVRPNRRRHVLIEASRVQKKLLLSLSTMGKLPSPSPPPHAHRLVGGGSPTAISRPPPALPRRPRDVGTADRNHDADRETTAPACARPVSPVMMLPVPFSVSRQRAGRSCPGSRPVVPLPRSTAGAIRNADPAI